MQSINKTFSWTYIIQDTTYFTCVDSLRDTRVTVTNLTAQLNQCREKNISTSTVRRRLCETVLYGRITVKKPLLRKKNNLKRFQWATGQKDWTKVYWGKKVLWTDESKFEIFGLNKMGQCAAKSWWQSCNPLYHTGHKAWRRLCYGVCVVCGGGGYCQLQSQIFASGVGQIESDRLSQYTAALCDLSWNAVCGSKICTHATWWPKGY